MSCSASWPGTRCEAGYCVGSGGGGGGDDACGRGAKECVDGDAYRECQDWDGDGSAEWSGAMSCSASWPGTRCDGGYCGGGGGCCDACGPGAKECLDGDAYRECQDWDGDGCAEWSGGMSCSASWPGSYCSSGWCVY